MTTELETRRNQPPAVAFRKTVESVAQQHYAERASTPEGQKIVSRFALSFAAAARASRTPDQFYNCDPASVAAAVALSLDTGLLPGGAMPAVWLIPKGGALQWMPSHRGLIMLGQQAGYQLRTVAVGMDDELVIEDGEVKRLIQNPDSCPDSLDTLRGIVVYASRLSDGSRFGSWWLNGAAIRKRATTQGAGPVWRSWPIEMAMKTAIKWVFARGFVPVESVELDAALSADNAAEYVEVAPAKRGADALLTAGPPAFDDADLAAAAEIEAMTPAKPPTDPLADLTALLEGHGLAVADLDAQTVAAGKPPPSTMDSAGLARVVGYLRTDAGRAKLADLRASLDAAGGE